MSLVSWQHDRKEEDGVTNKSYLVLSVSTVVRMEGRTAKSMSETDKQVDKGTVESRDV